MDTFFSVYFPKNDCTFIKLKPDRIIESFERISLNKSEQFGPKKLKV